MNPITAIAQAIQAFFGFFTKAVPSDAIREDRHVIAKPRLEQEEKIAIFNREFNRLKNHTELSIPVCVSFVDDNLNIDDQKELTELLIDRITKYRKNHPVVFRRWLIENKIK